jgi:hypothetical protein
MPRFLPIYVHRKEKLQLLSLLALTLNYNMKIPLIILIVALVASVSSTKEEKLLVSISHCISFFIRLQRWGNILQKPSTTTETRFEEFLLLAFRLYKRKMPILHQWLRLSS